MAALRRMARLAWPHAPLLTVGALTMSAASAAELSVMGRAAAIADLFSAGAPEEACESLLLVVAALLFAHSVLKHAAQYVIKVAGERVVYRFRTSTFSALLHSDVGFFDRSATGELVSILAQDVDAIHHAITLHLPGLLRHGIASVLCALAMLALSPRLTLTAVLVGPLIGLVAAAVGVGVKRRAVEQQRQDAATAAVSHEALSAVRAIKALGEEAQLEARYAAEVSECCRLSLREMALHKLWNTANMSMGCLAVVYCLRAGGAAVRAGELTTGSLVSFVYYAYACATAINDAANAYTALAAAAGRASKALGLLDEASARAAAAVEAEAAAAAAEAAAAASTATRHPEADGCSLAFGNVCFRYPAGPEGQASGAPSGPALDSVSFEVEAGRTTALCGPSGCGKSTLLALVLRFYPVGSGSIRLRGVELGALSNSWLRRHVQVVFQEPLLFRGTLAENIAFGTRLPDEDEAEPAGAAEAEARAERLQREVTRAASAAHAHEFVLSAGGYGARVGERGVSLSGGQRQRIAIARALLRRPSLLLLDEATSALDAASEQRVQRGIEADAAGRSTLVVAHRLSTVRSASQIVMLERGRVRESGTHDELLARRGLYARMVELQQSEGIGLQQSPLWQRPGGARSSSMSQRAAARGRGQTLDSEDDRPLSVVP